MESVLKTSKAMVVAARFGRLLFKIFQTTIATELALLFVSELQLFSHLEYWLDSPVDLYEAKYLLLGTVILWCWLRVVHKIWTGQQIGITVSL